MAKFSIRLDDVEIAVTRGGRASDLADDADDVILGEGARALCPRVVEDRLLVHGAVDVVRTEPERDLRHGHGQHHPVRLDVAEVIEQEACDRDRPQIVPHRRLPHRPPQLRI